MKMKLNVVLVILAVTLLGAWFLIPAAADEEKPQSPRTAVKPAKYQAHAWIRVAKTRPNIMFNREPTESQPNPLHDRGSQATLVRSSLVLKAALQQPGIAELDCLKNEEMEGNKIAWLTKNLKVGFIGESEILQIAITGENPDEMVKIVEAVRTAYMEQIVEVDRKMDTARRETLEKAYKETGKLVERKATELKELSEKLDVPTDSQMARYAAASALETVSALRNQINPLLADITGWNRRIAILQSRLALLTEGEEADNKRKEEIRRRQAMSLLRQDPEITTILREINTLTITVDMRIRRGENPDEDLRIQELQDEISAWQKIMEQRAKELIPIIMGQIEAQFPFPATATEKLREAIDAATLERDVAQQKLDTTMKAFKQAVTSAEQFSKEIPERDNLRAELDRAKKLYDMMGTQLDEWTIEAQAAPRIQAVGEAEVSRVN